MKNLIIYVLLTLFFVNFSFGQIINFPDINLKTKLLLANTTTYLFAKNFSDQWMKIDANGDGEIQLSEAVLVKAIYFKNQNNSTGGSWTVSDITGLESFSNLEYLSTSYNQFNSSVDFSALISLKELELFNCGITSLNVSGLNLLEIFTCTGNNLTTLDIADLPNLNRLNAGYNQISAINFNSNLLLAFITCNYNQISTLDFSNNPLLTKLHCRNNNLTTLNIKNGINQDFSLSSNNDCWKTGNPNLTTICADESEIASVQSFLDGCGSPQTISVNSNCNLSNQEFTKSKITIYPNPVNDVLNINLEKSIISSVTVFNTLGQKVYFSFSTTSQIDVSKLEAGAYFLKVDGLEGEYYGRFVKK